jgi:hypothetical protein
MIRIHADMWDKNIILPERPIIKKKIPGYDTPGILLMFVTEGSGFDLQHFFQ